MFSEKQEAAAQVKITLYQIHSLQFTQLSYQMFLKPTSCSDRKHVKISCCVDERAVNTMTTVSDYITPISWSTTLEQIVIHNVKSRTSVLTCCLTFK